MTSLKQLFVGCLMLITLCAQATLAEGWQGGSLPDRPSPEHRRFLDFISSQGGRRNQAISNRNTPEATIRSNRPSNTRYQRSNNHKAPVTRGGHSKIAKQRYQRFSPISAASHSAYYTTSLDYPYNSVVKRTLIQPYPRQRQKQEKKQEKTFVRTRNGTTSTSSPQKMAILVGMAYLFAAIATNLPIILMPTIAAEQSQIHGLIPAAFVATTASTVSVGGFVGKLANGLVCQVLGGQRSMTLYMTGMALALFLFSSLNAVAPAPYVFGWVLAGMEFLWSIQWTACSVVMANHFSDNPAIFAASITTLSLMSTGGTIIAKVGGTALLTAMGGSWSKVARVGALMALVGAAISLFLVQDSPRKQWVPTTSISSSTNKHMATNPKDLERSISPASILKPFRQVLTSRLFWLVGLAHSAPFLARTCDRVLGSFYLHVSSGLSRSLCGGLTTSCTLGFIHGLARGRIFHQDEYKNNKDKRLAFLRQNYWTAGAASLGLALCAGSWFSRWAPSDTIRAGIVALLSGIMTSCMSFQFYQIPNMFASSTEFRESKAVFLSLIDCMGYLVAMPVWAMTGQMVSRLQHGWSLSWIMLTLFHLGCGLLMLGNVQPLLHESG